MRWHIVRGVILIAGVLLNSFAPLKPVVWPDGNIGMITPVAEASGNCGIDRTNLQGVHDQFNWQTGIGQQCDLPLSVWNPHGHCVIIDAAHVILSKRLARELGILGMSNVEDRGDTVFIHGPVFLVIDKSFSQGEVYLIEGQAVQPQPGEFFSRLVDRIRVAIHEANMDFVPTQHGGWRPRLLSKELQVFAPNVNTCDCEDP